MIFSNLKCFGLQFWLISLLHILLYRMVSGSCLQLLRSPTYDILDLAHMKEIKLPKEIPRTHRNQGTLSFFAFRFVSETYDDMTRFQTLGFLLRFLLEATILQIAIFVHGVPARTRLSPTIILFVFFTREKGRHPKRREKIYRIK